MFVCGERAISRDASRANPTCTCTQRLAKLHPCLIPGRARCRSGKGGGVGRAGRGRKPRGVVACPSGAGRDPSDTPPPPDPHRTPDLKCGGRRCGSLDLSPGRTCEGGRWAGRGREEGGGGGENEGVRSFLMTRAFVCSRTAASPPGPPPRAAASARAPPKHRYVSRLSRSGCPPHPTPAVQAGADIARVPDKKKGEPPPPPVTATADPSIRHPLAAALMASRSPSARPHPHQGPVIWLPPDCAHAVGGRVVAGLAPLRVSGE